MYGVYLFVDHNGHFRVSDSRPYKYTMRKPVFYKRDVTEDYHGHSCTDDYFVPGEEIQYWGSHSVNEPFEWRDNRPSKLYVSVPVFGTAIPKSLVNDKFINMTFEDDPVLIEFD